jgi:hypothetical protein
LPKGENSVLVVNAVLRLLGGGGGGKELVIKDKSVAEISLITVFPKRFGLCSYVARWQFPD